MTARIALLLLLPLPAGAEPGPVPHEHRLDRHGYPLPPGAAARLGLPPPLSGFAWTLGWTADGSRFTVVDWSGVTVFDAATGCWLESQAIGTEGRSLYTPLSRDGRLLFLLNGRTGVLYDTTAADTRTFTLPEPFADPDRRVYSLTLSADCRFLAGVAAPTSMPGVAWRYDLARDKFTRIVTDRADLHSVRLSPDGRRIYATGGTAEPELTARDLAAGKEIWTTRLKATGTLRAVSADGRRAAVSDGNGLTVFDTTDGKPVLQVPVDSSTPPGLWGIDLSPDGRRLALAVDREVNVWDLATGKVLHRLPHAARLVAFSPDSKSLLTVSAWVQRWDVETGKPAFPSPVLEKPVAPSLLKWSGDGKRLLTVWPGDRRGDEREWKPDVLAVWDVGRMGLVWRAESKSLVLDAMLDRTGSNVRAATADNTIRHLSLGPPAAETAVELKQAPANIIIDAHIVEFLPDGRLAVHYHLVNGVTADVYDPAGGHVARRTVAAPWAAEGRRFRPADAPLRAQPGVLLSPDGRRVDVAAARPLPPLDLREYRYRPMGQTLSAGSALLASRVQAGGPASGVPFEGLVWDAVTGGYAFNLWYRIPDWSAAALSADGRWLANAAGDEVVFTDLAAIRQYLDRRGDPAALAGRERARPRVAVADTKVVAFSPDARSLATAHADGTVLIWETPPAQRTAWQAAEAETLWAHLAASDPANTWRSLWQLLDHPDRATELLTAHLKPVPALTDTPDQIARLDHPRYAVREAAARELADRGAVVEGDMRAVWEKTPSAEQRERLEALLKKLNPAAPPAGEVLRGLRAVWLLERIANDEAKRLLTLVAGGAPGSRVTVEAKAALGRLK